MADSPDPQHLVVVGAGIAGLAAAILLVRDHGFSASIYESQVDLSVGKSPEESYPVGVTPRGFRVLEQVFERAVPAAIELAGLVGGWSINASGREVARQESGTVIGTTRGAIVAELFREAQEVTAKGLPLEWHTGFRLQAYDAESRTLTFRVSSGQEVQVQASHARIIDSSGCWSKIREAYSMADASFVVERCAWGQTFRNLFLEGEHTGFDPKWHYIFASDTSGSYFASLGGQKWVLSVGCLDHEEAMGWFREKEATPEKISKLKAHVTKMFPKAIDMVDDEEWARFFSRRTFTGQVVKCSRINHGEAAVLIGDAAHAVLPATGEGLNSALEDVKVLVEALVASRAAGTPWFSTYGEKRLADVHALSDYARFLAEKVYLGKAERNRRQANMIAVAVARKIGLFGPTWNELTFGPEAAQCTPYSEAIQVWRQQGDKVRFLSDAIAFLANRGLPQEPDIAPIPPKEEPETL